MAGGVDALRRTASAKRFLSRGDAAAWLAETAADVGRGDYVEKSGVTVGDWINEHLVTYVAPRVSQQTLKRYIETGVHIGALGSISLQELRAPQVQALLNEL